MQTNPVQARTAADWLKISLDFHKQRRYASMLEAARRASALAPDDLVTRIHEIDCLLLAGETQMALERLRQIESDHPQDAAFLLRAGEAYVQFNRLADYRRCCERAFDLAPANPDTQAGLARALIAAGDVVRAEALLCAVTKQRPEDGDAWFELARLRRWTTGENHVASIERAVAGSSDAQSKAAACYALYKELVDLGQEERAWSWLRLGASTLRSKFSYRVEIDESALAAIARNFPAERLRAAPATGPGRGAIFVVGLPRSGTTLVDRILSAHPMVESLGEHRDLTYAVMRGGAIEPGPAAAAASRQPPGPESIGHSYLKAVAAYRDGRPNFVDKAPMNFLNCGMIRLALPEARVVMLRRHPLDSCLAIHTTFFRERLPFAYDLQELGRYYAAWYRLSEHWRQALPAQLLVMPYESLVTDPERQTRRLLEHCGLDWDPRCLDFHLSESAVTTLSASQVRRPLYASSVGRWKVHARELEPLVRVLQDAGIPLD